MIGTFNSDLSQTAPVSKINVDTELKFGFLLVARKENKYEKCDTKNVMTALPDTCMAICTKLES